MKYYKTDETAWSCIIDRQLKVDKLAKYVAIIIDLLQKRGGGDTCLNEMEYNT
jgi:hypothetical protein